MADPALHRVRSATAPVTARPQAGAPLTNQLLFGEAFVVEDWQGGFAQGRSQHDDYQGWVPAACLGADWAPTHRVTALATLVFPAPTFKAAPNLRLGLASPVALTEGPPVDGFCASHHPDGFIPAGHLGPLSTRLADWADTAARYAGVPYLWGGRSADGIDCSGLVQVALGLAGHPVPRDSPDQAREIGTGLPADSALKRGDLVFLPGHVAIMLDGEHAVHASSDPMAVVIEPIAAIAARITAREGAGITGVRRP